MKERYPHVVVKDSMLVPIKIQQTLRVAHAEVFKVEQAVRMMLSYELHKPIDDGVYTCITLYQDGHAGGLYVLVDKSVICFAADSLMLPALLPEDAGK